MPPKSKYEEYKRALLVTIVGLRKTTGRDPSMQEVADILGLSVGAVHKYVNKARDEELIEWNPSGRQRSLRLSLLGTALLDSPDSETRLF